MLTIYHHQIPTFILELVHTKEMQRLQNIGMNCGCEYTNFVAYQHGKKQSRLEHSIGVALIIWHFTKDKKQTIAGLLHDISTPVFSHTIDFLNKDYETQESTEEKTEEIIVHAMGIQAILQRHHIQTKEIVNYHQYPIADNVAPKLSADRLEYTLSNFYYRGLKTKKEIQNLYNNIIVATNEQKELELVFQDSRIAYDFTIASLDNSYYYIAEEDRFSMQYLADMLQYAIDEQKITKKDLYQDEKHIIQLLQSSKKTKHYWKQFTQLTEIYTYKEKPQFYAVQTKAKLRYIDPLVGDTRVSVLFDDVRQRIHHFSNLDFQHWISEKSFIIET